MLFFSIKFSRSLLHGWFFPPEKFSVPAKSFSSGEVPLVVSAGRLHIVCHPRDISSPNKSLTSFFHEAGGRGISSRGKRNITMWSDFRKNISRGLAVERSSGRQRKEKGPYYSPTFSTLLFRNNLSYHYFSEVKTKQKKHEKKKKSTFRLPNRPMQQSSR